MKKIILLGLISSLTLAQTIKLACDNELEYPLTKVAKEFKKQTGIDVEIVANNEDSLIANIKHNNSEKFDLFLPSTFSLISTNPSLFTSQKLIGYNKPVIVVRQGNPKNIKTLDDLTKSDVTLVLAKPATSSIGKTTQDILTKYKNSDFANKLYQKAIQVPTTNEITKNIKKKIADASINWKTTVFQEDNDKYLSLVNIPYIAPKQQLVLVELKEAPHPKLAQKFISFLAKAKNRIILKKLGLK